MFWNPGSETAHTNFPQIFPIHLTTLLEYVPVERPNTTYRTGAVQALSTGTTVVT
jgi:hypothetical protein